MLGVFEPGHMEFDHDRNRGPGGEPGLAAMTVAAIRTLSRNPDGFVLMVESGRIDHANHNGNAFRALDETISLSDAVRAARAATSADDTLIIVTADHSHVLNFVGYPVRGNPILGKVRGERSLTSPRPSRDARTFIHHAHYFNGPGNTVRATATGRAKTYPHAPSATAEKAGRICNAIPRPTTCRMLCR